MRKYILMALMALVASPVWAGSAMSSATISETLTLTSPSAVISMTGASATAYLRNVSVTGVISATTVSATNVSATTGIALRRYFESSASITSAAGAVNVVHTCGAVPRFAWMELINVTADNGYTPGMVVHNPPNSSTGNTGYTVTSDSVSTTVRLGAGAAFITTINPATGVSANITAANWQFKAKVGC